MVILTIKGDAFVNLCLFAMDFKNKIQITRRKRRCIQRKINSVGKLARNSNVKDEFVKMSLLLQNNPVTLQLTQVPGTKLGNWSLLGDWAVR